MPQVNATIEGIVLYCDDSLDGFSLGNGYTIHKQFLEDLSFKERITDGRGKLTINYLGSQQQDDTGRIYFLCVRKDDTFTVQQSFGSRVVLTDSDLLCTEQLESYMDQETSYLNLIFTLLHVFKEGNIGYKELFITQKFSMGILNNTNYQTSDNVTRNIVDSRIYALSDSEKADCQNFIRKHNSRSSELLRNCLNEFVWGLEQTDHATGFEQFTTALEMTLLAQNQQGKKQVLSKRVAVLLSATPADTTALYNKMLAFYRYRSESLHEGEEQNITESELHELEGIVRSVMQKYLDFCLAEVTVNPALTWDDIKAKKINDLKNSVQAAIASGVLPA